MRKAGQGIIGIDGRHLLISAVSPEMSLSMRTRMGFIENESTVFLVADRGLDSPPVAGDQEAIVQTLNRQHLWGADGAFPFFFDPEGFHVLRSYPSSNENMNQRVLSDVEDMKRRIAAKESQYFTPTIAIVSLGGEGEAACPYCQDGEDKDCFRSRATVITSNFMPVLKLKRSRKGVLRTDLFLRRAVVCSSHWWGDEKEIGFLPYVVEIPFHVLPKLASGQCAVCKSRLDRPGEPGVFEPDAARYFCQACGSIVGNQYAFEVLGRILAQDEALSLVLHLEWFHVLSQVDLYTNFLPLSLRNLSKKCGARDRSGMDLRFVHRYLQREASRNDDHLESLASALASLWVRFAMGVESSTAFLLSALTGLAMLDGHVAPELFVQGALPPRETAETSARVVQAAARLAVLQRAGSEAPENIRNALCEIPFTGLESELADLRTRLAGKR